MKHSFTSQRQEILAWETSVLLSALRIGYMFYFQESLDEIQNLYIQYVAKNVITTIQKLKMPLPQAVSLISVWLTISYKTFFLDIMEHSNQSLKSLSPSSACRPEVKLFKMEYDLHSQQTFIFTQHLHVAVAIVHHVMHYGASTEVNMQYTLKRTFTCIAILPIL